MTKPLPWLILHVMLLLLASTGFTVVKGLADGQFRWQYFQYHSQDGWGKPYEFPYSLPVVLTYLFAYAIGMVAFGLACRSGSRTIGLAGVILFAAGFASFAFELSHWFVHHYSSWIASAPIALFVLAIAAGIQQHRAVVQKFE